MATAMLGNVGGCGSASASLFRLSKTKTKTKDRKNGFKVSCVYSPSSSSTVADPYKILRIRPGASESEVKKAFRQLALQYHPDVCKGSNCGVQFHQINEAYDVVMDNLRDEARAKESYDESLRYDPDDLWEEWMGWEGAGIRDYSSHINPYIEL